MRTGVWVLLLAAGWPVWAHAQERRAPPAVDSTLVVVEDVTADGLADTLLLRVQGDSLNAPLGWSLEIRSQGRVIFADRSDPEMDASLHRSLQDPDFGDKATFYFATIPRRMVQRFHPGVGNETLKEDSPYSVYAVIPAELRQRGVSDAAVLQSAVEGVVRRLTAGTTILSLPNTPHVDAYPMIWIPEIGEFVVFYRW